MNFEEYLIKKKIDKVAFEKGDPRHFNEWKELFDQISEPSFTTQKLYLINGIRRKFPLTQEAEPEKQASVPSKPKPVIKRPKIN